jgi:hypothetical protein
MRRRGGVLFRDAVKYLRLIGLQLVKKFLVFYGTRRFITAFTSARYKISPRPCEIFRNIVSFYCEELLATRLTIMLEDHTLSAVRDCLLNMFAATLYIWRPIFSRELKTVYS